MYCVLVGFTWRVLQWNLFYFARDLPCPRVSRGVLRLHCFFYLSGVCGTCFFNLPVVAMGSKWSSSLESTRPPDEGTRFVLVGARRVFASSTNTCYLSGRHLCFAHRSHPSCHSGAGGSCVRSLFGWELWLFPPRWILERWHCFCCKTYQGEEQMQEEDL